MKRVKGSSSKVTVVAITSVAVTALATTLAAFSLSNPDDSPGACDAQSVDAPGQGCAKALAALFEQGKQIFRFDTFGDEDYWGGTLQLHKAIEGAALGGVGPGVSPKTALTVAGLKVDVDALPGDLQAKLKQGKVDLDSPATTLALLKLNAVVGVKGVFDKGGGSLSSIGITCALCHSTVDDSFAPGIGKRLDGWPNQDLNTGLIVSLAPNLAPVADKILGASDEATIDTLKKVLLSWGPGFYDAEVNIDAIGFRPDGKSAAVRIPAAYGHLGEDLHTWTGGFGNVTYWNAYVANLQMHGKGNFNDERFNDPAKYPAAVRAGSFKVRHDPDLVTSKLAPLHFYQLSLKAPKPPAGSFDPEAAKRGEAIFNGQGKCAECHMPPLYTDAGYNAHTPAEMCIDSFQADRGPTGAIGSTYVTPQLKGLWARSKRGFFHDGRFPTLLAVIDHYDACFTLGLRPDEKRDLVEFLKSL
jgi:phage baseplate assembly protein gpV